LIVITNQHEVFLPHRRYAHVTTSLDEAALREIAGGSGFRHTLYVCRCHVDPAGPALWTTQELDPLPQASHWGRHRHFAVTIHPDAVAAFMEVMESAENEQCCG
jgi:hypothetical protein